MIIKNNMVDPYQKTAIDQNNKIQQKNIDQKTNANTESKGDKVSLSEEAMLRTQAYSDAMAAPNVRAEKVAALKEQVNNGTYAPNSKRTATAMVADMVSNKSLYI